ncbi:MAG: hypothetical protein LBH25_09470 [Fibromonadaceae bacterium]|jgi:hypothetical protein|nr:hypothetical protein [Fibromonadaceae bacterium]
MRNKCVLLICLLLFSQQAAHSAQSEKQLSIVETITQAMKGKVGFYFWPVFFGGGNMLLTEEKADIAGYVFSGGLTASIYKGELFFFGDALYSYRVLDRSQALNYRIEEHTTDLALGVGVDAVYVGGYVQFPMNTMLKVSEWTMEDFEGISRVPSVSFMLGWRMTLRLTKIARLGIDARLLIGQGPGQFLKKSLGDNAFSQISLGIMGGI